jgi:hypothetical protein
MKTVCAWDNVACLVDTALAAPDSVTIGAIVVGLALLVSVCVASYWKGL